MLNTSKYELWKFKIHFQCHYFCYHNIFTSASTPGSQNPERKSICFNSKLIISKKKPRWRKRPTKEININWGTVDLPTASKPRGCCLTITYRMSYHIAMFTMPSSRLKLRVLTDCGVIHCWSFKGIALLLLHQDWYQWTVAPGSSSRIKVAEIKEHTNCTMTKMVFKS